jgi:hypothetical protein
MFPAPPGLCIDGVNRMCSPSTTSSKPILLKVDHEIGEFAERPSA